MSIEIVSFIDDHLKDAAALVAARYRVERGFEQSLPARFENPDATLSLLQRCAKNGTGVSAIHEGKLVGFLMSLFILLRGVRTAYVPDCGHAGDSAGMREIYREMYASLARQWTVNGYFSHAVTVLAHESEALDAWYSLGFGLATIDALRDYLPERRKKMERAREKNPNYRCNAIFLNQYGKPVSKQSIRHYLRRHLIRLGLIKQKEGLK